jgi:rare lipoprotein A (peptidoglycan hydrolase)
MTHKKLAILLTTAVMLGQASLIPSHLAQANTEVPGKIPSQSPVTPAATLQVASVIPHTDINTSSDDLLNNVKKPETPDIYTIGAEQGKLRTIIQVIPQDNNYTSLFVNGSEILRFHGTIAGQTSYQRVKDFADALNRSLSDNARNSARIKPDVTAKNAIRIGTTELGEVDAETAKAAQEAPQQLAFMYTNRLRQSLGQMPLPSQKQTPDTDTGSATAHLKNTGKVQVGMASWYGGCFHGRRTASGIRFNQFGLTAAHRTLPFGTLVRVTNQRTRKSCVVQITDRGPYAHGRIIDLSKGAARVIGMPGVARVSLEVVSRV